MSHDDDVMLVEWKCFAIACWRRETRATAVQLLAKLVAQLGKAHPSGIGLMQLVSASARPPEARAELSQLLETSAQWVRCSSLVVVGEGFRMAAARALAATLIQLARPPFPHKVFASVEQAATWHRQVLPPDAAFDERALASVAQSLLAASHRS